MMDNMHRPVANVRPIARFILTDLTVESPGWPRHPPSGSETAGHRRVLPFSDQVGRGPAYEVPFEGLSNFPGCPAKRFG